MLRLERVHGCRSEWGPEASVVQACMGVGARGGMGSSRAGLSPICAEQEEVSPERDVALGEVSTGRSLARTNSRWGKSFSMNSVRVAPPELGAALGPDALGEASTGSISRKSSRKTRSLTHCKNK